MRHISAVLLLALVVTATGCFHTRVETGLTPGSQVYENSFAPSFVYGLVPPPPVDGAAECPSGVAIVESEISFLNGLVAALTFSLFTPMTIKVTCAAGGGASATPAETLDVAAGASSSEVRAAIGEAADRTVETKEPVFVQFTP